VKRIEALKLLLIVVLLGGCACAAHRDLGEQMRVGRRSLGLQDAQTAHRSTDALRLQPDDTAEEDGDLELIDDVL